MAETKLLATARENEERRKSERKRNILYLIWAYLKEQGYKYSADSIANEAHLTASVDVCDNIDLDMIVQEYCAYFFTKFKKYPHLCKRTEATPTIKIAKHAINVNKMDKPAKKPDETTTGKRDLSVTVTKPFVTDNGAGGDKVPGVAKSPPVPLSIDYTKPNPELKELSDTITKEIVTRHVRNVSWDEIQGLTAAKQTLKEAMLYPIWYPRLFSRIPVPWKGILLYGAPGTGKTLLVRALASQCPNTFFNIASSTLTSKWRGESEKLVRILFELARYEAPSTIFIDEIDALTSKRDEGQHDASRRFKSELLIQMDGVVDTQGDRVVFLATSNLPWEIDSAILRRFDKKILVDFPDLDARCDMFRYYLSLFADPRCLTNEHFLMFGKLTQGYTGADIKIVCKEAAMMPIRIEILQSSCEMKPINCEMVLSAIKTVKPSVKYLAEKYHAWTEEHGN